MPTPTIREAIYTFLSASSAITNVVSDRIFFERLPDDCGNPALLVSLIDGNPDLCFSGLTGLVEGRLQIDIFAELELEEQIEALREALLNLSSGYQDITVDSNTFQLISFLPFDYGRYLPEPQTQTLHYSIDFDVKFGRS